MTESIVERPCPVHQLTRGPKHHFFGYYEKSPWDADDRLVLCGEVDFNDRMPTPDDVQRIGVIDTTADGAIEFIDETRAWCFQQGGMLQWLSPEHTDWIIFNDRAGDRFVARLRNLKTGETKTLGRAIYQLDPRGRYALSLNFARLGKTRPGYGYEGVDDPWHVVAHPEDDGLYRIDLDTGRVTLLFSLSDAAMTQPIESMRNAKHWFNHIQVSRDGSRFAVLHRWQSPDTKGHLTRVLVGDPFTGDFHLRFDNGFFSHYDWLGDDMVVGYARVPGTENDRQFLVLPAESEACDVIGQGMLDADGHNTFSPDRRWMLGDISYGRDDTQTLWLYRWPAGPRVDVAVLNSHWIENRPLRCDLHPRWNRAGDQVCIDSLHDGTRQMYVVDVSDVVNAD